MFNVRRGEKASEEKAQEAVEGMEGSSAVMVLRLSRAVQAV
jgi:hypothetical protein